MKVQFKKREDGSMLLVAMIISIVVTTMLAGYLLVTSNRFQMTVRSQDWNAAIPVLEAGIEEALTHLKDDTTPTANSWTLASFNGTPAYTKQRSFSDGSYYFVAITTNLGSPLIYSQGFVRAPYKTTRYICRTVKVGATNIPSIFTHAFELTGGYRQSGGVIDAYNPSLGPWNAISNRLAVGGIATDYQGSKAIDLSSSKLYGPVSTGPGATISVSGSGAIGDVTWANANTGVETGWSNNTMNVPYPTNASPVGYLPPTTTTNMTTGTNEITGNFTSSSSSSPMIVNGKVTLIVDGTFTISGSGYLQVNPGASLTLICKSTVTISGGGAVNATGDPSNLSLIGTSSCTGITYSGSSSFIGTVNALQAAFVISGSADAYGAVIAASANVSGGASFHYPINLGARLGYLVSSWQEL
jgi:hypothetical protein